jgi:hypothetical protein
MANAKKLHEEVEGARTELNPESVDDAVQFIKDAHEKFHLFQGHRIRVSKQREEIGAECQEKRKLAHLVWRLSTGR